MQQSNFLEWIFETICKFFEPKPPLILPPAPTEGDDMVELTDGWPEFDGPLKRIPRNRKEMVEIYGAPNVTYSRKGVVRISKEFAKRFHTVPADLLTGYHRRIYCHRDFSPYLREALRRAQMVAPGYKFERVGCFSPRHMRHSKNMPLSDHTWGVAVDINASRNRARYRKPTDPRPFEDAWYENGFSDLPESIVLAFKSVGFSWGGDWGLGKRGGYHDPMHFSLRK